MKYIQFHQKKHVKIFEGRQENTVEGEIVMIAAVSYEEAQAMLQSDV